MKVSDCTLRDFFGSALINSSSLNCQELAEMIADLDIDELEVGDPMASEADVRLLKSLDLRVPIATFYGAQKAANLRRDLEFIKSLGVNGVIVSIPASDQFARLKLPTVEWDYRFELMRRSIEICNEIGLYVAVTGEDSPSADIEYLREYLCIAHSSGARKFRYAESVSKSLPIETYNRVRTLLDAVPGANIEMHCHDMFGLALANGISGIEAGATWISGTFLGAGERGGNINTIDALTVSKFLFGQAHKRLENINAVAGQLASVLGMSFLPSQRIIGHDCFAFEQPTPLKNQNIYLPFDPREVGQITSVVLTGKHSIETLEYVAAAAGVPRDDAKLKAADLVIRQVLRETGRTMPQKEVEAIIRNV